MIRARLRGVKLVHSADLHLDSPLRGLQRYEGAPVEQMRGATRLALESLVDLCLDEGAALLLIAGDLYDGDWKDYSTGLFFARQMSRLRRGDVHVVWIRGNHDAASQISKHLQLPDNVTELSTLKPETIAFEELGIAVHGQGFSKRVVTEDLASNYPAAIDGAFNIGLLHTAATGREGHEQYAPCSLETLLAKGYDYWALGHVHKREVLCEEPWVVFPGNLQGRHAKETGAKGATIVTIEDGRPTAVRARAVDAVRWCRCEVAIDDARSPHEALDLLRAALSREVEAAAGRALAARIILQGASAAHDALVDDKERWEAEIRALATDLGDVWVEKVKLQSEPIIDLVALGERDDAVGQIVRALQSLRHDDERVHELIEELAELRRKLPAELRNRSDDGGLRLDDPTTIRAALHDVQHLLLARLLAQGRNP